MGWQPYRRGGELRDGEPLGGKGQVPVVWMPLKKAPSGGGAVCLYPPEAEGAFLKAKTASFVGGGEATLGRFFTSCFPPPFSPFLLFFSSR